MQWNAIRSFLMIVCLLPILNGVVLAQEIIGIYGECVSTNRGDLYWFVEGINERLLYYDDGSREFCHYVSTEVAKPRAAVKFDSLETPLVVKSILVFVSDYDYDPGQPGNELSPFYLGLYSDQENHPGEILDGPFTVQAQGNWDGGGEWVTAETNYLLTDAAFWNVFIWKDEHPAAPTFGLDFSGTARKSVQGYYDNGWVWQFWKTGNFMLRAIVLENDRDGSPEVSPGAIMPDSFRIYSAGHADVCPSEEFYQATALGQLHERVVLYSPENYFCVTAFYDQVESAPSRTVMIEGGGTHADVDFVPNDFDIILPKLSDTSLMLEIHNDNGRDVNFRFYDIRYDYRDDFLKIDNGPVLCCISPQEGSIQEGFWEEIQIGISTENLFENDCLISLQIEFWDDLYGYADEEFEILVRYDELTPAGDESGVIPEAFWLGQNFPNPFNSETIIPYNLGKIGAIGQIEIYNLLGEMVLTARLDEGEGLFRWNTCDHGSACLASGVYFYILRFDTVFLARKMLLLK
jgi:hypothetical protein